MISTQRKTNDKKSAYKRNTALENMTVVRRNVNECIMKQRNNLCDWNLSHSLFKIPF
jgi:hypothetical protein